MNKGHLCEYGCGQEAKYQMKNGKWCCSKKTNSCPKIRKKNSDGLKMAYKTGKLNAKMNYFNQSKESKEKQAWSKGKCLLDLNKVFKKNTRWSSGMIKKYLLQFKIKKEQCDICKLTTWNNKKIPLECHHIDGDSKNNSIENLQLLCLNCHAQTSNFRGEKYKQDKK